MNNYSTMDKHQTIDTLIGKKPALPPKPSTTIVKQNSFNSIKSNNIMKSPQDPTEKSVKERMAFFQNKSIIVAPQTNAVGMTTTLQRKIEINVLNELNGHHSNCM